MTAILGISAFYHDSAAALVVDGAIVAAAQEERFTRKKHDADFPVNAIQFCLKQGGIRVEELDHVAFYDKPLLKFERLLETYLSYGPVGYKSFVKAMPVWLKQKLYIPRELNRGLGHRYRKRYVFTEHHESHAASAFFPSPFEEAAVMTLDGVGEWATASFGYGKGNKLELTHELHFPHSLGLLYSAFTYYCGFRVNSGEYKLMGLAPYGEPVYADAIREELIDIREDGSFRLNQDYFGYLDGLTMTNDEFAKLFGGPARKPESQITKREMDLARSVQVVTEEVVLKMARHAAKLTGEKHLCLAGGVALNCVANGRILREGPFEDIWIQPAAGDAGGALGAALFVWHQVLGHEREADGRYDRMSGAYLGPVFPDDEIAAWLDARGFPYRRLPPEEAPREIARLIAEQNVVGLVQGRMEFGPRALGSRSIVGDARSPKMQSVLNLKIKYRESFRPFAPSCLEERIGDYFEIDRPSPYMLLVAPVREGRRTPPVGDEGTLSVIERVNRPRSDVPAITHVDFSARIQSVSRRDHPRYWEIIKAFEGLTDYGIIINTSFNVRGEPIVCTPEDAYRCFMRTEMDYLVMGDLVLAKTDQPSWREDKSWQQEFTLD
jgi:carbamoyltransferase